MGLGNKAGVGDGKFRVDPGWYEYDGMVMTSHTPPAALDKAKQFEFHDDDVLCACYPKTGQMKMSTLPFVFCATKKRILTQTKVVHVQESERQWTPPG